MKNGNYTVFVIQHRQIAKGPWLKPDAPIVPLADGVPEQNDKAPTEKDWSNCGDYFFKSLTPHDKLGYDRKPKFPEQNKEWDDTSACTGVNGWWTLSYAAKALKRVQKDDAAGMYDSREYSGGSLHQRVRHEYRIVKMTLVYNRDYSPLTANDAIEALA